MGTAIDLGALIARGEHERQIFREGIPDVQSLERELAGFANARGGIILIGVRPPSEVVGCDRDRVRELFQAALKRLQGAPNIPMEFQSVNGKDVAAIAVPKAVGLVYSSDGVFLRQGREDLTLSDHKAATQMTIGQSLSLKDLADLIANQAQTIMGLTKRIEERNRLKHKLPEYLLSGAIGAVICYVVWKLLDRL